MHVKSLVDIRKNLTVLDKIISYHVCCTLCALHLLVWSFGLIRRFADWLAGLLRILHLWLQKASEITTNFAGKTNTFRDRKTDGIRNYHHSDLSITKLCLESLVLASNANHDPGGSRHSKILSHINSQATLQVSPEFCQHSTSTGGRPTACPLNLHHLTLGDRGRAARRLVLIPPQKRLPNGYSLGNRRFFFTRSCVIR